MNKSNLGEEMANFTFQLKQATLTYRYMHVCENTHTHAPLIDLLDPY